MNQSKLRFRGAAPLAISYLLMLGACGQDPTCDEEPASTQPDADTEVDATEPDTPEPDAAVPDAEDVAITDAEDVGEPDLDAGSSDVDADTHEDTLCPPDDVAADADTGDDADSGPAPCELPFTGIDCDVCSAGYDAVPIDIDGTSAISCAALGPVWGNAPISPFGVYASEEVEGDLVVTDTLTMLMWQGETPAEPSAIADARATCDASTYGGFADWRLPYVHELTSMVNFDVTAPDSTLSTTRFPGTDSTHHWTYNDVVDGENGAWMVSFGDASLTVGLSDQTRQVRCVRPIGGLLVDDDRFETVTEAGIVLDTWTSLYWQQTSATAAIWTDAKVFCAELEAATFDDWRLPTVRELHGLADFRLREPALNGVAFPDAAGAVWWSRTPDVNDPTQGWSVDFEFGSTALQAIDGEHGVRCVRGE